MKIGLCYNLKEVVSQKGGDGWDDSDAEYEDAGTIENLARVLEEVSGGSVVHLPCDRDLPDRLGSSPADLVFNIAEGWGGRNREAYAPNLFEMAGIPYTGSDGLALSLTLDKVLAKKVLLADGFSTPDFLVIRNRKELKDTSIPIPFPLFVKPVHEGTSKGIRNFSMVTNPRELEEAVAWVLDQYRQPALVEQFIAGTEVAVAILEEGKRCRILPHAEIRFSEANPFYSFECKSLVDEEVLCPASLEPSLRQRLESVSRRAFRSFGCRDLARLDFRIDEGGKPYLLEVNPLPGLSTQYSLFPIQARAAGIPYEALIRMILNQGASRYGLSLPSSPGLGRARPAGRKPGVDARWKDQVRERVREPERLARHLKLDDGYRSWLEAHREEAPFAVTPYLLSLMASEGPGGPVRRQFLPAPEELQDPVGSDDPLREEAHEKAPGLIQVYPDRAAWRVSSFCPSLCRHCLRRDRFQSSRPELLAGDRVEQVLHAVAQNPEIRDLLLTGGDPLIYEDDLLEELLRRVRALDQIELVRIGSRLPCTLPQRITGNLLKMLRQFQPLWISTQFNHPDEITPEAAEACRRIADAGIPVLNQSVLLRGINDDPSVMKKLVEGLVRLRVRPYYLYQCQLIRGTSHFRTPVERGIELLRELRGRTSGFAIPQFVLDTPYGKVPLGPDYYRGRVDGSVMMESYTGRIWTEKNPLK